MRRWPISSPDRPGRIAGLVLVPAGLVVGIAAERAAFDWDDPRRWVPDLVVGLTFIGAGAFTVSRRPGTGWLLAATGFAWFLGNFDGDLRYAHRGPLVQCLVVYVGWRARTLIERVALVAGYVAAVLAAIWGNDAASFVLSGALVAVAAHRWATAAGRMRSDRWVALRASVVFAVAVGVYAVVNSAVPSGAAVEPTLLAYEVALCVVAVMLTAHLVAPSTTVVADLVVEIGESRSGSLRDALAETLGDPTLEIAYWSVAGEYRDSKGRPIDVPVAGDERAVTYVEREARPFAMLVHDSSVLDEPALVEAVASATRLSAANAALTAEVRGQIAELARSRRRLVLAADEERRRLEARLHDGVERRIEGLVEELRSLPAGDGANGHVRRAEHHLEVTLADLRQLALGLHPRDLDRGLPAALAALAQRCTVPVDVSIDGCSQAAPEVAAAAYFVAAEALTNVAKHAGASRVTMEVVEREGWLRVALTDDGAGSADPAGGSGLRGLIDRVEALGGTLTVSSPPGAGTRLTADVPLR